MTEDELAARVTRDAMIGVETAAVTATYELGGAAAPPMVNGELVFEAPGKDACSASRGSGGARVSTNGTSFARG